jgi:poly(glycerol-phosphate) alpha-glucosyltransferase
LQHNVFVLGVRDQYTDADMAAWKPVPFLALPVIGPERFSFAPGLNRKLMEANPDILQLHGLWRYTSIVAGRWHRQTGKPYIVHPHGMLDPWAVRNSHWKKALAGWFYENRLLRDAACIRALCESEAKSIRKYGCSNPICIIPNGIDLRKIENAEMLKPGEMRAESGSAPWKEVVEPGRKVLLFLSRIHPKKGLVNLLKAWAENPKKGEWVLAIAGWDEAGHEQELKQLATGLGLAWMDIRKRSAEDGEEISRQKIKNGDKFQLSANNTIAGQKSLVFLGPQFGEAKTACYANCDAFILPSFSEGLPMVVLEAWAHGKPVIMTPECNLPEGFSAGAAVMIPANSEGISDGLSRLFGMSAAEMNKMGQRGLRLTVEKFNWQTIAVQLQSVCSWVLEGGVKPDCVYLD